MVHIKVAEARARARERKGERDDAFFLSFDAREKGRCGRHSQRGLCRKSVMVCAAVLRESRYGCHAMPPVFDRTLCVRVPRATFSAPSRRGHVPRVGYVADVHCADWTCNR